MGAVVTIVGYVPRSTGRGGQCGHRDIARSLPRLRIVYDRCQFYRYARCLGPNQPSMPMTTFTRRLKALVDLLAAMGIRYRLRVGVKG